MYQGQHCHGCGSPPLLVHGRTVPCYRTEQVHRATYTTYEYVANTSSVASWCVDGSSHARACTHGPTLTADRGSGFGCSVCTCTSITPYYDLKSWTDQGPGNDTGNRRLVLAKGPGCASPRIRASCPPVSDAWPRVIFLVARLHIHARRDSPLFSHCGSLRRSLYQPSGQRTGLEIRELCQYTTANAPT